MSLSVFLRGSIYEEKWSLYSGKYVLFVDRSGIHFSSDERSIFISRELLRRYGIRKVSKGQAYFFVEIGSKCPAGEGVIQLFYDQIKMLDEYVKSRIKSSGLENVSPN